MYPGFSTGNGAIIFGSAFAPTSFITLGNPTGEGEHGGGVDILGQAVTGTHWYAVTITPSTVSAVPFSGARGGFTYAALTEVASGTVSGSTGSYKWQAWERVGDAAEVAYNYGFTLSPAMSSSTDRAVGVILRFDGTDGGQENAYTVAAYSSVGALIGGLPAHTAPSEIFDQAVAVVGFRSAGSSDQITPDPPYADTAGSGGGFATFGESFFAYSGNVRDDPSTVDAVDDAYYHRNPATTGQTVTSTTVTLDCYVALIASGTGPERPITPFTNCDFFERADGGLGSNWDDVPFLWQEPANSLVIIDGAAEDGRSSGPHEYAAARYTTAQPPNQIIEAEITRLWQTAPADVGTSHYATLLTNMTTTDQSLRMLEVFTDVNFADSVTLHIVHFDADGNPGDGSHDQEVTITTLADTIRVRFESDTDNTCRAYVDGSLRLTWVDPSPATGTFCGIATSSGDHTGTIPQWIPSVRFNEVCFPGTTGWRLGGPKAGASPW